MELLEFARGPALTFAITIFIAGMVFRIVSLFLMWRTQGFLGRQHARDSRFVSPPSGKSSAACGRRPPTSNARCSP